MIPQLRIEDYHYPLSDERIAKYPLAERDASKLLYYKEGNVSEYCFRQIPELLPEGSVMVFNDTKVVPARIHFQRETGAHIEIFCLQPVLPADYAEIFATTSSCRWKCVIGNVKRWKNDVLHLYLPEDFKSFAGDSACSRAYSLNLRARLVERLEEVSIVEFEWDNGELFSNVLDICGNVPIPPYLNRETEAIDLERYQTMYARYRGSVAAPTAGLHFTQNVMDGISARGIDMENVCLHVGAGTFLPVKSSNVAEHPMHRETCVVKLAFLKKISAMLGNKGDRKITAVGTTSVRTLESLFYVGVSCIEKGAPEDVLQWVPYEREYPYTTKEAIDAIIAYLEVAGKDEAVFGTRIIIVPGFRFRLVDVLVTNFHQPESTLILLVSAFVDGDWRTIYDYALAHDFRFLSYGDSSLLFRR